MSRANTPTPLPVDRTALDRAVTEVAEETFFAMVDPAPGQAVSAEGGWLTARVTFEGGFGGSLSCTMPRALAHELTRVFAGAMPDEIPVADPAVDDLAGEFANMVCGRWLTDVAPDQQFTLAHLSVEPMAAPASVGFPTGLLNGQPIWVELSLDGEGTVGAS